jgi:glycosyltransferase involved in cell wall biosynthesis
VDHGDYDAKGKMVEKTGATVKTVLLVSPLPPPSGGIASWTRIVMAKGLPAGFRPVVVDTRMAGYPRGPRLQAHVGEVIRTGRILFSLKYKLIRYRPRIVHLNCSLSCNGIFRDLVCGVLARLFGRPLLTHYRGDVQDYIGRCGSKILRSFALRSLLKMSRINVTLNAASLACAQRLASPRKVVLLPNFIEDDILSAPHGRVHRPDAAVRALYVGNFLVDKGLEHIRSVSRLLPDVHFHLVGEDVDGMFDGPDPVPENVTLFAPMDRESVLAKMRESDLYVFPSRSEGFPNSVLEAMAMGLPVVATRVGAIPEMVEDGKGGYLVARDDVEGLARAVRTLAGDARLREKMGLNNRERSRSYAYSAVAARLADLYETLL